ncbi:MAG: hypothetical protein OER21_06830 [Gemmatimonadota bacterium]|nr:hypothetical protein [Gemmatimonadota bacterium]
MADTVPPGQRLDRSTLERVILRAAELQSGERDLSEGLTEEEVLRLASEVGIPAPYVRQALVEEQSRAVVPADRGLAAWLAGPRHTAAERTVRGSESKVTAALGHWMTAGELLTVKRRFPDQTSWEPQRGTVASLKRSFRLGGREYVLARAREVVGRVTALGPDRSHVRLAADLGNSRNAHLGAAGVLVTGGAAGAAVAVVLGFALPVAVLPVPLALLGALIVTRSRQVERYRVALEQVLDRLEHGEIRVPDQSPTAGANPLNRIAQEIRRQLGT